MIRLHVICEGQTEELFVNEILHYELLVKGVAVLPSLIGKPGHKGGNLKFDRLFSDIRNRLLGDHNAYCTTFFDFFALPSTFPGKLDSQSYSQTAGKSRCVCDAMVTELGRRLGADVMRRFIPYVQMHEFEGLLFSRPEAFASALARGDLLSGLNEIRHAFASPEDINDSPTTAPSKRLLTLFPEYEKPLHGSLVALETGLNVIRQQCRLFDEWVRQMESIRMS